MASIQTSLVQTCPYFSGESDTNACATNNTKTGRNVCASTGNICCDIWAPSSSFNGAWNCNWPGNPVEPFADPNQPTWVDPYDPNAAPEDQTACPYGGLQIQVDATSDGSNYKCPDVLRYGDKYYWFMPNSTFDGSAKSINRDLRAVKIQPVTGSSYQTNQAKGFGSLLLEDIFNTTVGNADTANTTSWYTMLSTMKTANKPTCIFSFHSPTRLDGTPVGYGTNHPFYLAMHQTGDNDWPWGNSDTVLLGTSSYQDWEAPEGPAHAAFHWICGSGDGKRSDQNSTGTNRCGMHYINGLCHNSFGGSCGDSRNLVDVSGDPTYNAAGYWPQMFYLQQGAGHQTAPLIGQPVFLRLVQGGHFGTKQGDQTRLDNISFAKLDDSGSYYVDLYEEQTHIHDDAIKVSTFNQGTNQSSIKDIYPIVYSPNYFLPYHDNVSWKDYSAAQMFAVSPGKVCDETAETSVCDSGESCIGAYLNDNQSKQWKETYAPFVCQSTKEPSYPTPSGPPPPPPGGGFPKWAWVIIGLGMIVIIVLIIAVAYVMFRNSRVTAAQEKAKQQTIESLLYGNG